VIPKVTVVKVGRPLGRFGSMYNIQWTDVEGRFQTVSLRGYRSAHGYARSIRRSLRDAAVTS